MDSETSRLFLPITLIRGLSDLAVYPLFSMSVIMQGAQPYSTIPRAPEAIETRIYALRGGTPGAEWKQAPPCVRVYRDTLDPYYAGGFKGQYKGFLIFSALRLSQTLIYATATQQKDWWGYAKICTLQFLIILGVKPLKTAYTRFVLQSRDAPAYSNLKQYFTTTSLREMYQGLPYTLAKEVLLLLYATHSLSLGALLTAGYPLALAETRMEAMSSHKGLQAYRYTNRTILRKIVAEEGLLGLYRGLFAFGLYVRHRQQSFHTFATLAIVGALQAYLKPKETAIDELHS
jgi:hypothetical protein